MTLTRTVAPACITCIIILFGASRIDGKNSPPEIERLLQKTLKEIEKEKASALKPRL